MSGLRKFTISGESFEEEKNDENDNDSSYEDEASSASSQDPSPLVQASAPAVKHQRDRGSTLDSVESGRGMVMQAHSNAHNPQHAEIELSSSSSDVVLAVNDSIVKEKEQSLQQREQQHKDVVVQQEPPPLKPTTTGSRFVSFTQQKLLLQRQQFLEEDGRSPVGSISASFRSTSLSSSLSSSLSAVDSRKEIRPQRRHGSPRAGDSSRASSSAAAVSPSSLRPSTSKTAAGESHPSSPSRRVSALGHSATLTAEQRAFQRHLKDETRRVQSQLGLWWTLGMDPMRMSLWRVLERLEGEDRAQEALGVRSPIARRGWGAQESRAAAPVWQRFWQA